MVLLTPGPCMTSDRVRHASAEQDLNHREPRYQQIFDSVRRDLCGIYPDTNTWQPYLIGGSGTAAVEAMLTSCIGTGKTLVIANGYYSARIADILAAHKMPHRVLDVSWTEPISQKALRNALATERFEAVVATHNETTTGRLNDIQSIATEAREHGAKVLLDMMSSFGAEPADLTAVDAICASANKCLHGLPGVSFVLANPQIAATIATNPTRGYYLSLAKHAGDSPPMTPPVPAMMAFAAALTEFNEGGVNPLAARHERYRRQTDWLRHQLRARGFDILLAPREASVTLIMVRAPRGWSADQWIEANRNHGYLLYGCKGDLRPDWFQVSVMGEVTDGHLTGWIEVVDRLLAQTGTA